MSTGPAVNYARIDAALAAHKAGLARAEAIAAMQVLVDAGAKAFIAVDGYSGPPMELPQAKAQQLLAAGRTAADSSVAALGAVLVALTQGLPP